MDDGQSLNAHLDGFWPNEAKEDAKWEYAIGVDWQSTVPIGEAWAFKDAFAIPSNVCRLRDPKTLSFLVREFGLDAEAVLGSGSNSESGPQ